MKNQSYLVLVTTTFAMLLLCGSLVAQTYSITTHVISNGGTTSATNGSYTLEGTVKQTTVGNSAGNYMLQHGYWPWIRSLSGCCIARAGNEDGDLLDGCDIADLSFLYNYLYFDGPIPACMNEAEVDGSPGLDIGDASYLTDYLYNGGPPPPVCP